MPKAGSSQLIGYPLDLGDPIRVFHQGATRALLGLRVIVLIAFLSAIAFFTAVFSEELFKYQDGASILGVVISVGLAVFVAAIGYSKTRSYVQEWRDLAVIGSEGFGYRHGDKWQQVRWSEITQVIMTKELAWSFTGGADEYGLGALFDLMMLFVRGHQYYYSIDSVASERIAVGGTLTAADKLMEMVQERAFPVLLGRATELFDAGHDFAFGPISVNKDGGLSYGQKRYTWDNIQSMAASKGADRYVQVKPKKGRFLESVRVREHEVPNIDVLMCLAARMMGCPWELGTRSLESAQAGATY